jgi:hypothetical protein
VKPVRDTIMDSEGGQGPWALQIASTIAAIFPSCIELPFSNDLAFRKVLRKVRTCLLLFHGN